MAFNKEIIWSFSKPWLRHRSWGIFILSTISPNLFVLSFSPISHFVPSYSRFPLPIFRIRAKLYFITSVSWASHPFRNRFSPFHPSPKISFPPVGVGNPTLRVVTNYPESGNQDGEHFTSERAESQFHALLKLLLASVPVGVCDFFAFWGRRGEKRARGEGGERRLIPGAETTDGFINTVGTGTKSSFFAQYFFDVNTKRKSAGFESIQLSCASWFAFETFMKSFPGLVYSGGGGERWLCFPQKEGEEE